MSELNLVLPGLIWPNSADYEYLSSRIRMTHFSNFCAKGRLSKLGLKFSDFIYAKYNKSESSLANHYAIELGVSGYLGYMLMEPTHLRLDRDRLLISESELLQLSTDDAQQIITLINEHFVGELKVFQISDELWLIGLNFALDGTVSYPLIDIIGENVDEFLPIGPQRLHLHKLMNEIQMLLFNVPLNKQREEDGLLNVNSVWLWDKHHGKLPFKLGDILVRNSNLDDWNLNLAGINTLIVDKAYFSACYRDSFSWLEIIAELDSSLGSKLSVLLKSGKLTQLNIYLPVLEGCYQLRISRFDLLKFWRKKSFAWHELAELEFL